MYIHACDANKYLVVVLQNGWLSSFLRVYIKAFQQASDLDDSVEDKLLIGDRPKPHVDSASNMTLNERLAQRPQAELEEVGADVASMNYYTSSNVSWIAYARRTHPP